MGLQTVVDELLADTAHPVAVDIGCGAASYVHTPGCVIGLDLSERQLRRTGDIHSPVVADVHACPLRDGSVDAIVCFDTLEHLQAPLAVVESFARILRPGGVVVIGGPNLWSLKGLITKLTPHWVHVAVYRYLLRFPDAGKADTAPFRTYHRITPAQIREMAARRGLHVAYYVTFDASDTIRYYARYPAIGALYDTLRQAVGVLSGGRIGDSEFRMVLSADIPTETNRSTLARKT